MADDPILPIEDRCFTTLHGLVGGGNVKLTLCQREDPDPPMFPDEELFLGYAHIGQLRALLDGENQTVRITPTTEHQVGGIFTPSGDTIILSPAGLGRNISIRSDQLSGFVSQLEAISK